MRDHDLILVTDMQNVYTKGRAWACLDTEGAAARIGRIVREAERRHLSLKVMLTEYLAPKHPVGAWKVYNETYAAINEDPYLNALIPEMKSLAEKYPVFSKSTYSSMSIPEVRAAAEEAERVVLTGVVSECCVLSTAFAAIDLGCHVVWLKDAVSGFDRDKERGAELMLEGLAPVHTTLMTTEEYLGE